MTHRSDSDTGRGAYGARLLSLGPLAVMLLVTALVATATFVLSAHGLIDYGRNVAGVPSDMAWLLPVGIDLLSVAAIAATFVLRGAPLRYRVYSWSVFGVTVVASIGGNLAHADYRHLSWQGSIGATIWPVLLAFTVHLLIVVWRYIEASLQRATSPEFSPRPPVPASGPGRGEPGRPAPANPPGGGRSGKAATPPASSAATARKGFEGAAGNPTRVNGAQARAVQLVAGGMSCRKAAKVVGTAPRNVERWTKALRNQAGGSSSPSSSVVRRDDAPSFPLVGTAGAVGPPFLRRDDVADDVAATLNDQVDDDVLISATKPATNTRSNGRSPDG